MLKLLFFAKYREVLGVDSLEFPIEGIQSISDLIKILSQKGENWQSVFSQKNLMVAVNQSMVSFDTVINNEDEIAFFPPVSGG